MPIPKELARAKNVSAVLQWAALHHDEIWTNKDRISVIEDLVIKLDLDGSGCFMLLRNTGPLAFSAPLRLNREKLKNAIREKDKIGEYTLILDKF